MEKPKIFQTVILGIFSVFLIVGFLAFSGKIPLPEGKKAVNYGMVTLWGTIPSQVMQTVIADKLRNEKSVTIEYVEKNKDTFSRDFIEALASGKGPDLFIISQDEILRNMDKVSLIPYTAVTERDFKNTFIEEGEMFLRPGGIVAIPLTIDPMVMYWNRDIFTNASIVAPPDRWTKFYDMAPKIIIRDSGGDIVRSFVSFGEYQNVLYAKDILSTLIMQTGVSIVENKGGLLTSDISIDSGVQSPAAGAISFFTEFARPDKDSYSWNRSLPYSRRMFDSGDLALYFGYASEYNEIKQKNPHLNFDVAAMPQVDNTAKRITFGRIQGVAILKSSKNLGGAMQAALLLSNSSVEGAVAEMSGLPPVRRDLIALPPADAVFSVLYDSALISRAWYDPSPVDTDDLFRQMISDIGSGRLKVNQALAVVQNSLGKLLVQYSQQ